MEKENRNVLLVNRPEGMPEEDDFKITSNQVPDPGEGEVLIQAIYLSVDPYMRGRMSGVKTYVEPYGLNEPLTGGVVGKVVKSNSPDFEEGDTVEGYLKWADYTVAKGKYLRKINPDSAPISTALGIAGMPGLTAYFGLLDIGKPKEGETVVVSGAAGAVGTVVGQIAKLNGCRVIGIAGSEEKTAYLENDLGFNATINYKTDDVADKLKQVCPDGVDIYFDNVGGEISDAVLRHINYQARIILCGQISSYNNKKMETGPRIQGQLLQKSALMKGFIVSDYADRFPEAYEQLGSWITDGKLTYRENIVKGLENAPKAFIGLFRGENLGKQLVQVRKDGQLDT